VIETSTTSTSLNLYSIEGTPPILARAQIDITLMVRLDPRAIRSTGPGGRYWRARSSWSMGPLGKMVKRSTR